MNRFFATAHAARDLAELRTYLDQLPSPPGNRIGAEITQAILMIVAHPYRGNAHSELTRLAGQEVRSWRVKSYRIYYQLGGKYPEIIGILHSARDHAAILRERIQ